MGRVGRKCVVFRTSPLQGRAVEDKFSCHERQWAEAAMAVEKRLQPNGIGRSVKAGKGDVRLKPASFQRDARTAAGPADVRIKRDERHGLFDGNCEPTPFFRPEEVEAIQRNINLGDFQVRKDGIEFFEHIERLIAMKRESEVEILLCDRPSYWAGVL